MYDFANFTLHDMTECGIQLRKNAPNAAAMETAARNSVHYLYENLCLSGTKEKACAMVRFYRTLAYGSLNGEARDFARKLLGDHPEQPEIKCLTLLASVGDLPEWNNIRSSRGHRAIPLPSEHVIEQAPMISQLIREFGINIHQLLTADPGLLIESGKQSFNVFYVPKALGSPYIPAQDGFVIPHRIESVLGFGGILPDGDLFAIIMFSKIPIGPAVAEMFKTVALNVKIVLLPLVDKPIFDS